MFTLLTWKLSKRILQRTSCSSYPLSNHGPPFSRALLKAVGRCFTMVTSSQAGAYGFPFGLPFPSTSPTSGPNKDIPPKGPRNKRLTVCGNDLKSWDPKRGRPKGRFIHVNSLWASEIHMAVRHKRSSRAARSASPQGSSRPSMPGLPGPFQELRLAGF